MDAIVRHPMLSSAEADLVRRDPAIPGLATVLDPEAFLVALGRAAPGRDLRQAQITYVKYRPETYCRVGYRVEVAGAGCDLDVRACRPEDLDSWLERGTGPTVPGPLGPGRLVLGDSAMLVTVFPNDPGLPQVPSLIDPSQRMRLLRDLLPGRPDLWEGRIRCLRYWPGRRYSVELSAPDGSKAMLKAYTPKGYRRARRNAEVFRSSGPLQVARLLGFSDSHRVLAFEWLPGRMLSDLYLAPEIDWEAVTNTGAALASMHAQPPDGLERWTRGDETAYLLSLAREIGFLCPRLSARADGLARRLAAWLAGAPVVHLPVHGDLSDAQVLIDGKEVAIVDLDSAYCGDPADDLGSLLAQSEIYALCGKQSHDRVHRMRSALLEGYRNWPNGSSTERIGPYTASGLLRRTRFAFRARKPDWQEITESSLERAEEILNRQG